MMAPTNAEIMDAENLLQNPDNVPNCCHGRLSEKGKNLVLYMDGTSNEYTSRVSTSISLLLFCIAPIPSSSFGAEH